MKRKYIILTLFLILIFPVFAAENQGGTIMKLTSPEFENNSYIPAKFTCEGQDINPALLISGVPKNAESLVLIVDDPDAPRGDWVHWVVFDIKPGIVRIDENSVPGREGMTDSGSPGYGGPCPPSGTHRYFFKIYALDSTLGVWGNPKKSEVLKAMNGHILDKAELVGLYRRSS